MEMDSLKLSEPSTPSMDASTRNHEGIKNIEIIDKPLRPPTTITVNDTKTDSLPNKHSKRIKIDQFEDYVKESIENGDLEKQHALFPRGQTKSWDYGITKENKSKNRYNNLIAYDHSRVILEKLPGDESSDYVNANYIHGYKVPKAYIATQGPKVATLNDFWRMIWQENIAHIVNLANVIEGGKKKVEKYWPDINHRLEFGEITVSYVSSRIFADYEERIFNVNQNGVQRKLTQLHFVTWPDHGVPLYSQNLEPLLQKTLKIHLSAQSPILVHCSAGVGRTGTFLMCDYLLRMAAGEGVVDFLQTLANLRAQRPNMVDNYEQYKLAHLVVLECLVGMQTAIECSDLIRSMDSLLEENGAKLQMQYLRDTAWKDKAMRSATDGGGMDEEEVTKAVATNKDRFPQFLPDPNGRVFISRYPHTDEMSSYINAVRVDGFRIREKYIVTQQPMPGTVNDFWRMVSEHGISVIISLNKILPKINSSCKFYPDKKMKDLQVLDLIRLQHINTRILDETCEKHLLHMYVANEQEHKEIQILSLNDWLPGELLPKSLERFLTFWEEADALSRASKKVIVTCYDGVTASGVYIALSFIIDKMKLEQICDVCQAVRTIRYNRAQFVGEEVQLKFLYESAIMYLTGFQSYSNFV